ncbi:GDSL esterase/lipase At2g30220-like [Impatiens glandulifera]|uniref:GDSL esterase/lipase At2g30220-like n=1 Tax=Impatiens glandulifera TaxID=253017 RepID=UPI001FB1235E|nr:GDSL esterase/lipase At2g30220-like [Impatiens glandulifera]
MAHKEALLMILLSQLAITNTLAALPKFTSILIFGDSLLDTGNNNFLSTNVKSNHTPYGKDFPGGIATGRFSNGVLMSDMLASGLGIKELVPPFLDPKLKDSELRTGVCFASAGSGYDDRTATNRNVLPVMQQPAYLANYTKRLKAVVGEAEGNRIVKGSLAVVFSGSNDMIASSRRHELGLDSYDDFLLSKVTDFIKALLDHHSCLQLYAQGVRNILVGDIPPLRVDAPSYNKKLKELLPKLQTQLPGSKLVFADLSEALTEVLLKGFLRGSSITDLLGQCCPGLCTAEQKPCENADKFYRWDTFHPTQAVYRLVTKYLLENDIPKFA